MATLPITRAQNDKLGRRKSSGRSVSSGDVTVIPADIGRPRQINAPSGAFESPLAIGAEELAPAAIEQAERMRVVEAKEQSREDTLDRVNKLDAFNNQLDDLVKKRVSENNDLDKIAMFELGLSSSELEEEIAGTHGGTPESLELLRVEMTKSRLKKIGEVSKTVTEINRGKVKKRINEETNDFLGEVAENPTFGKLSDISLQTDEIIEKYRNALEVGDEEEIRATLNAGYAKVAVNTLINQGKIEQATALMGTDLVQNSLSQKEQIEQFNNIQSFKKGAQSTQDKIADREQALGRKTTDEEREIIAGLRTKISSNPKERDIRIAEFVKQGFSEIHSRDIVDGILQPISDDVEGNPRLLNIRSREIITLDGQQQQPKQAAQPTQVGEQQQQNVQPTQEGKQPRQEDEVIPGKSVFSVIDKGTGLVSNLRQSFSDFFGIGLAGPQSKATTDARIEVDSFTQTIKEFFATSKGKFSVTEQENVERFLPKSGTIFIDPDTAFSNLVTLKGKLERMRFVDQKELNEGSITVDKRKELMGRVSDLNRAITMLGKPLGLADQDIPIPKGLPEGSKVRERLSKSGKTVFILPDGTEVIEKSPEK